MSQEDRADPGVSLRAVPPEERPEFKRALQESFRVAAEAELGQPLEEPIPSDEDIDESFRTPGAEALWIVFQGEKVGGAVVVIDPVSGRNSLAFFFVSTALQGRGLGLRAWRAVEGAYPSTTVWETVTPYFEKRNIHFYVNRCGFQIVEYYNRFHPDPHEYSHQAPEGDEDEGMFRFEKRMRPHA